MRRFSLNLAKHTYIHTQAQQRYIPSQQVARWDNNSIAVQIFLLVDFQIRFILPKKKPCLNQHLHNSDCNISFKFYNSEIHSQNLSIQKQQTPSFSRLVQAGFAVSVFRCYRSAMAFHRAPQNLQCCAPSPGPSYFCHS